MKGVDELLEGASLLHVDADTALDLALAIQGGLPVQALEDYMARQITFDYIAGFYNQRRRHSTLGYKSPVESYS
jgi:transposase InsO family protein